MAKSFEKFIQDNFYNEIYAGIETYFHKNRRSLDLSIPRFFKQWRETLSDIHIKYVNAEDKDPKGMKIDFYPIVVATFEIEGRTKYDVELDTKDIWFRLHCSGDLSNALSDFTIHNIEVLSSQFNRAAPVTDSLVPYIKSTSLEDHATRILSQFYPEALEEPQRVSGKVLAERMGLSVIDHGIEADASIFGQIYFYDAEPFLYDRETGFTKQKSILANTIIIDSLSPLSRSNENITIAHECVHYALHRKVFEFARVCNYNLSKIQCGFANSFEVVDFAEESSWMEWHANFIAPRIIMPINQFKEKADFFIKKHLTEHQETEPIEVMESVIDSLAQFFDVPKSAAKTRLVDVGFYEAVGTYIYTDKKRIKPHKPSKANVITGKQTYSIGLTDLFCEILGNSDLKTSIDCGKYVYVDSHVVLNTPKYVDKSSSDTWQLTKYARHNMDECCLVFDVEVSAKYKIPDKYATYCVLNREADSPYEIQIKFHDGYENASDEKQTTYLRNMEKDAQSVYLSLPRDLGGTIETLKKWKKMTNDDIADEVMCNEKTIRRIINGDTKPTLENLLPICFALKLTPVFTYDILEKAGLGLRYDTIEQWHLSTLITIASGKSMKNVRKEAERLGIDFF